MAKEGVALQVRRTGHDEQKVLTTQRLPSRCQVVEALPPPCPTCVQHEGPIDAEPCKLVGRCHESLPKQVVHPIRDNLDLRDAQMVADLVSRELRRRDDRLSPVHGAACMAG